MSSKNATKITQIETLQIVRYYLFFINLTYTGNLDSATKKTVIDQMSDQDPGTCTLVVREVSHNGKELEQFGTHTAFHLLTMPENVIKNGRKHYGKYYYDIELDIDRRPHTPRNEQ